MEHEEQLSTKARELLDELVATYEAVNGTADPATLVEKLAVITIFEAEHVRAAIERRRALERERLGELIAAAEATCGPVDPDEVRANSAVFARARAGRGGMRD